MNERNRLLFTGRSRRITFTRIALGFLLFILFYAWAYAAPQTDISPFSDTLKDPPAFVPEFMAEKENAATLYADGIYAVYATDRADKGTPAPITASHLNGDHWPHGMQLGIEARGSPVQENHGNAERLESVGGLVKGTLHF